MAEHGGFGHAPRMDAPSQIEVLVVGAGPTGLMLANQLARRGVSVLVVDRNPGPSVRTKALGVQARTMEIYARLGIIERALDLGTCAVGANMWVGGRRAARVPLGDIGCDVSPYPFLLILGQDDNERLLGEHLRTLSVEPRWSTELVGLEQAAGSVSATLKQPDGSTRTIRASWVAGCDGAHSAVRRLSKIEFLGAPYEHVFFVADARVTGPMVPGELNVYLWRDGFHLLFPMRGADHWRVVGILPPELRGQDDVAFEAVVPDIRRVVGSTVAFHECSWFATYRIHHRRAARFREGRCFLLGDAAHIHSPVGAQGMNTGLQDAYNLGWKLALVAAGRAEERLLDSYSAEREPVAERLLQTTDRAFSLIVSDGWLGTLFRTRVLARILAFAMGRERFRRLAFRTISQIGIHYRDGPLSQPQTQPARDAPAAGDRFPWLRLSFAPGAPAEDLFARLDDTRFNLLLFGQRALTIADGPRDLLAVHAIPTDPANDRELARARIPAPCFYLLRPDGHIGLAGAGFDADLLSRYLAGRIGIPEGLQAIPA
jgi:2-polyprenyl-6-methoxyphenol hydroxylase-like FAD-dependent oxidoreductase